MGHICAAGCTPSPPLGAERGGVRWGTLGASGETHLTFPPLRVGPLPLPPEGRRGNLWHIQRIPASERATTTEVSVVAIQMPIATATMPRRRLKPIGSPSSIAATMEAVTGLMVSVLATRVGVVRSKA